MIPQTIIMIFYIISAILYNPATILPQILFGWVINQQIDYHIPP